MRYCFLAVFVMGCGSDVIVAGSYTVAVTNGENACNLQNWTVGDSATGIPLTITQTGSSLTSTVNGLSGAYLPLVLGSSDFAGAVCGNEMNLRLVGTRAGSMGGCSYTVNANVSAVLNGDALQGSIDYVPQTNHSTDCGTLNNCLNVQAFNGTRPPTTH